VEQPDQCLGRWPLFESCHLKGSHRLGGRTLGDGAEQCLA
jgi:hypothetical protein